MTKSEFDQDVFESLLEFFPGHVFWIDSEGLILGANDKQAKNLAFEKKEDIIGKYVSEICSEKNAEVILENNKKVLLSNEASSFEELNDQTVLGERYFQVQKIPLRKNGKPVGVLGLSTDITDKKLRQKLEAEQEVLKKANEMMRFWAGAIAHEIRTPLMSIAMMADTLDFFLSNLKQDYPELWKDSPRKATSLEYIQKLPKNFAEITKGMNHFVDMALMKVSPERARVYELKPMQIKDSVKMVLDAYPFKMLDEDKNERDLVHVNILDNFTFNGDETLFRHLIYNLVKNAIFFVRKAGKGEVFIDAIAAKKTDKDPHPMNLLILKDTGPGIPTEHLQHLFKAFFSRSQNGTGVGLSLCKTIMNEFGGRIYCESVEGEFTKFVMEFPA